ncbi:hypothetical protein ACYZT4_11120 [Pseudomonas sp. GB2N2]
MSKLRKLREWLTIDEAAKQLSISLREEVNEADILRLALDDHLTLSVYFVNHARGRPARIEPLANQPPILKEAEDFLAGHADTLSGSPEETKKWLSDFVRNYRGDLLPNGIEVLVLEGDGQKPVRLEGVWDLLMLGAERLDIEHAYQNLTGGPAVELVCLGGPLVSSPDRGHIYQLLDNYKSSTRPLKPMPPSVKPQISKGQREALDLLSAICGPVTTRAPTNVIEDNWDYETVYYPASGLPEGHALVVRTAALRELEKKLLSDEEEPEKPLHPSERKSVAQIIAALAAMAGLDLSAPYAADETLRASAAVNGLELPASPETVAKFFKDATARGGKG